MPRGKREQETVSQQELEALLDVSHEAVRLWRQEGCPFQEVDGRKRYVVSQVVGWQLKRARERRHGEDLAESKKRREAAEARKAEVEADLAEKRVVEVDKVVGIWREELAHLRGQMTTFPQRWAHRMVGLRTVAEASQVLDEGVRELMGVLSETPE